MDEDGSATVGGGDLASRTPSSATNFAYGLGAIVFGVKDTGFSFFLLLFYSQVIGLDARLVGVALTLALALDALLDPVVGYWSDNFRSRWGRRHIFMYPSSVPIAVCYYLLWTPPSHLSGTGLFAYLLVLAVATRAFITFFETPNAALGPELTHDYDQRSALMSYRTFFGWAGGNATTVLMFFFLFPAFATKAIPQGQFNRDAYAVYGACAAGLMLVAILISSFGTHSYVARLKQPPKRRLGLRAIFREIFETLWGRSSLALVVAAMFGAVATGLASALSVYFSTYFWAFSAQQIGGITLAVFASALAGAALTPVATRRFGKKNAALLLGFIGLAVSPLAILLRLFGFLADGSDPTTFWTVFALGQLDVALAVSLQALVVSMIADLVEHAEVETGRRSEGVFFAANTFIQKMVSGIGVMAATLVLSLAHFPANATPSAVSADVLQRLAWTYLPALLALRLLMMIAIANYSLTRTTHQDNLRKLADLARKG